MLGPKLQSNRTIQLMKSARLNNATTSLFLIGRITVESCKLQEKRVEIPKGTGYKQKTEDVTEM